MGFGLENVAHLSDSIAHAVAGSDGRNAFPLAILLLQTRMRIYQIRVYYPFLFVLDDKALPRTSLVR